MFNESPSWMGSFTLRCDAVSVLHPLERAVCDSHIYYLTSWTLFGRAWMDRWMKIFYLEWSWPGTIQCNSNVFVVIDMSLDPYSTFKFLSLHYWEHLLYMVYSMNIDFLSYFFYVSTAADFRIHLLRIRMQMGRTFLRLKSHFSMIVVA